MNIYKKHDSSCHFKNLSVCVCGYMLRAKTLMYIGGVSKKHLQEDFFILCFVRVSECNLLNLTK